MRELADGYLKGRNRQYLRLDEMFALLRVIQERMSPAHRSLMYPYQQNG